MRHARWQTAICKFFFRAEWNCSVAIGLTIRTGPYRWRIPDVVVLDKTLSEWTTEPPLAVFEVLGDEDCCTGMREKLAEYEGIGVPQIWMVDSDDGAFIQYLNGGLRMEETTFRHEDIAFELPEIAALLRH